MAAGDVPMANDCHDPGTGDVTQQTNCQPDPEVHLLMPFSAV